MDRPRDGDNSIVATFDPHRIPRVSVIIPTYNREQWLPRSIGSVQRQTFTDWECLVIDDHSTDGSWELLQRMAASDHRIRPLKNQRTKGVSGARNTGLDLAKGEFLAFLDSDDEWLPHHLKDAINALIEHGTRAPAFTAPVERRLHSDGSLFGARRSAKDQTRETQGVAAQPHTILAPQDVKNAYLSLRGCVEIQTFVISRTGLKSIRFPEDLRLAEDGFFFLQLAQQQVSIIKQNRTHGILWAHDSNTTTAGGRQLSATDVIKLNEDFVYAGEKMLQELDLLGKEKSKIKKRLAQKIFWNIGYNGYLRKKQYRAARQEFLRAVRIQPLNLVFYKVFFISYVRQWLKS